MDTIILEGRTFYFTIRHKQVRSIHLRLTSTHTFEVVCPLLTPHFLIKRFIVQNSNWIVKHAARIPLVPSLLNRTSISILGKTYLLHYHTTRRDSVVISDDLAAININSPTLTETHVRKLLSLRLKKYADSLIRSQLRQLQSQHHFTYGRVTLRNQKTRFGSCSSAGNLNFNWQIIFFPYPQFRHILLHEIAHLTHHDHSKKFWALLASYDPDWKSNDTWLKKEGSRHFLIS